MANPSSVDLSRRQVLVNLGNRWAVFGSHVSLPRATQFTPADGEPLSRVADESEVAEDRIIRTLRLTGAQIVHPENTDLGDLEFVDDDGKRTLVEIKVREHEPNDRDFRAISGHLNEQPSTSERAFELWYFNIERLKLHIYSKQHDQIFHSELAPLDVWEYGDDRSVFNRSRVVDLVEDWMRRIDDLYRQVEGWVSRLPELRVSRTRSVEMSEEPMQKFAVADRELLILDIVRGEETIISFVPRGRWVIGAKGRVDIITKVGTRILVDTGQDGKSAWNLIEESRRMIPFDENVVLSLLGEA